MKVKMLTITNWQGELRRPGDVFDVASDVAARWERNGIAVAVKEKKKESDGLDRMTVAELQEIAVEKGIAPGNMKKDDLIAAIRG